MIPVGEKGFRFWIFFCFQCLQQLFKFLSGLVSRLIIRLRISCIDAFQSFLGQFKDRIVSKQRLEGLLPSFFETLRIQEKGEVLFVMPHTSLLSHSFRKTIAFDTLVSVKKKNLKSRVIQPLLKLFADPRTCRINRETHLLKGSITELSDIAKQ
jgi:hypothetical protein